MVYETLNFNEVTKLWQQEIQWYMKLWISVKYDKSYDNKKSNGIWTLNFNEVTKMTTRNPMVYETVKYDKVMTTRNPMVYRIAGYFRGVYISRTANSILVREK